MVPKLSKIFPHTTAIIVHNSLPNKSTTILHTARAIPFSKVLHGRGGDWTGPPALGVDDKPTDLYFILLTNTHLYVQKEMRNVFETL